MGRILGISGYLRASAIALLFASGCAQSEGERCQINSDCADGLTCQGEGVSQGNGVCKPANSAATTGKDAAADLAVPQSDALVAPQLDADSPDAPSIPSPDASLPLDTPTLDVTPVDTGAID